MARSGGTVRIKIGLDPSGVTSGAAKAEASLTRLEESGKKSMAGLAAPVGHLHEQFKGLIRTVGGTAAAWASIEGAKGAIETTDQLAKTTLMLRRSFGLAVDEASKWAAVTKSRNIDPATLSMGFTKLSKSVEDSAAGSTKAHAAFIALGVTQDDLKRGQQDFPFLLQRVTQGLEGMKGGTEKATLAQALFGRGYKALLPLLSSGPAGFAQQAELAEKYGATLKDKTLGQVEALVAAQRQAAFASMGLQVAFGTGLAPVLTKVTVAFSHFVQGMQDGTGAGGKFVDAVRPVAEELATIAKFLGDHSRLIVAAAGAWAIYKTAAVAALVATKAKAAAAFVGLAPSAAAGGAEAGAAFGTAASVSAGARLRAFAWTGLGKFIGAALGVGIASAISKAIGENADPLLFLHPPSAGGTKRADGTYLDELPITHIKGKGGNSLEAIIKAVTGTVPGSKGATPSSRSLAEIIKSLSGGSTVKGGVNAGLTYPLATQGKIIGTPHTGTHTLGNWQSDNAVDISVQKGTPVLAVEDGVIAKVTIKSDIGNGRFDGSSITLKGKRNSYFYTHLSDVTVKAGDPVNAGDVIGYSGVANGVPHLHFGEQHGNPMSFGKVKAGGASGDLPLSHRQQIVENAAKTAGIDPSILWGVFGQESNFGKNLGPSSAGAEGPFQIMPGTAKELGLSHADVMNFEKAAYAAARYLAKFKGRGTRGMLGAYNAGPAGDPNNKETRNYITKVLGYARQFPDSVSGGLSIDPTDLKALMARIAGLIMAPVTQSLAKQTRPLNTALSGGNAAIDFTDSQIGLAQREADVPGVDQVKALDRVGFLQRSKLWALQSQVPIYTAKINAYRHAIKSLQAQLSTLTKAQASPVKARIRKYQGLIKQAKAAAAQLGVKIKDAQIDIETTDAGITSAISDQAANALEIDNSNVQRDLDLVDSLESAGRMNAADADAGRKRIIAQALSGVYGNLSLPDKLALEAKQKEKATGLDAIPGAGAYLSSLNKESALASLTPDNADDIAAAQKLVSAREGILGYEQDNGFSDDDVADAATSLKQARDALDSLTKAVNDNTDKLQQELDAQKQLAQAAQRRANAIEAQSPILLRELTRIIAGELGNTIVQGMRSPSYAGGVARPG